MVYQPGQQPGDQTFTALLNGQIDGRKVGNAILQLLPAFPHEGPPGMPRGMAKTLFPNGFLIQQPVPTPEILQAARLVPPAQPNQVVAQPVTTPQLNQVNQVVRNQTPPVVPGYRTAISGSSPIKTQSQKIQISQRPRGM